MDFVKKFASASKPRLLSYESKQIAILGDVANYSHIIQPKSFLTFGFTSQILSYEGLDTLKEKQHLEKVFFGTEINVLLVGDNLKELDKRLVKLTNDLPSSLNKLSILYFQKYENHSSSDRIPKSIKLNSQIRLGMQTLSLADRPLTDAETGEHLEAWLGVSTPASRCSAFSPQFASLRMMEVGRDPNELIFQLPPTFFPSDMFAVQVSSEWMEEAQAFFLPIVPGGGGILPLDRKPGSGKNTSIFYITLSKENLDNLITTFLGKPGFQVCPVKWSVSTPPTKDHIRFQVTMDKVHRSSSEPFFFGLVLGIFDPPGAVLRDDKVWIQFVGTGKINLSLHRSLLPQLQPKVDLLGSSHGLQFWDEVVGQVMSSDDLSTTSGRSAASVFTKETVVLADVPPHWVAGTVSEMLAIACPPIAAANVQKMKFSVGEFRTNSWALSAPGILKYSGTVLNGGIIRMRMISTSDYFSQKEAILSAKSRAKPPAKGGKAKKTLTTTALAQHNAKAMAISMQKISLSVASASPLPEDERSTEKKREKPDTPSTPAKQKQVVAKPSPAKPGQKKGSSSPMKE